MPKKDMYLQFMSWARDYGEIFSVKVMNRTVVVLSSPRAVYEVMEKNAQTMADRPTQYIGHLLTGGMMVGMAPYGEQCLFLLFSSVKEDGSLGWL